MGQKEAYGIYGYRFQEPSAQPQYQLFAVGYSRETSPLYEWDGMKRIDGPLYLFQYTVSGCGRLELDGKEYDVPAGTAFLVEIPGKHRYFLPEGNESWEFYFVLFRQRHLGALWEELLRTIGPLPGFEPGCPVIRQLQTMYAEARLGAIQDGYRASALLYGFVMELLRSGSSLRQQEDSWPETVRLSVSYIETFYKELQSLDDIAEAAGCSKYHLSRQFKEATGYSPMDYTAKFRIEQAVELLGQTAMTIDEIAREVGYANGSYFSKVFRSRTGFPPSEFRDAKELPSFSRIVFD